MGIKIPPRDHKDFPKVMAGLAMSRYQSYLENAEPINAGDGAEFSMQVLESMKDKRKEILGQKVAD